jgi:hypothetical protein
MGNTRDTGHLRNVITYDSSGSIGVGGAVTSSYIATLIGSTKIDGLLDITSGSAVGSGLLALQLPTGVSASIGAGLSTRTGVAGESIIQFGNNHYASYTGTINQAKAGAMIRLDTRNVEPIPGSAAYSAFQIQVRGAGVASYTVPVSISGLATNGSLTISSAGVVSTYYGLSTGPITGSIATFSGDIIANSRILLTTATSATAQGQEGYNATVGRYV